MGKTLKVVDGQLVLDPSTGVMLDVQDEQKASQDLAQCQLQDFNEEQGYGSYLRYITSEAIPGATELFIRQYVAQAIDTLIQSQSDDPYVTSEEKITGISEFQVKEDDQGNAAYLVKVDTESGAAISSAVQLTSLKHLEEGFNYVEEQS